EGQLDSAGELGRVRRRQRDVRELAIGARYRALGRRDADSRMGVKNVLEVVVESLDGVDGLGVADALALEGPPGARDDVLIYGSEAALRLEILEPLRDFLARL